MKGATCNITIETADITNTLPQAAGSKGPFLVKLKTKLKVRGHIYFEVVSPESLYAGLAYLKKNSFLYRDINIDMICLPTSFTNLAEDKNTDTHDPIDLLGEHQNPLYKF